MRLRIGRICHRLWCLRRMLAVKLLLFWDRLQEARRPPSRLTKVPLPHTLPLRFIIVVLMFHCSLLHSRVVLTDSPSSSHCIRRRLNLDPPRPNDSNLRHERNCHAVEALYSPESNPVIDMLAEQGIAAIARALPVIHKEPLNKDARSDALFGAWACGTCLGAVGMSLHHKLCHTLGGSFNVCAPNPLSIFPTSPRQTFSTFV